MAEFLKCRSISHGSVNDRVRGKKGLPGTRILGFGRSSQLYDAKSRKLEILMLGSAKAGMSVGRRIRYVLSLTISTIVSSVLVAVILDSLDSIEDKIEKGEMLSASDTVGFLLRATSFMLELLFVSIVCYHLAVSDIRQQPWLQGSEPRQDVSCGLQLSVSFHSCPRFVV